MIDVPAVKDLPPAAVEALRDAFAMLAAMVDCPDGMARFQSVETHPDHRRAGVCSTLVSTVGRDALERGFTQVLLGADAEVNLTRLLRLHLVRPPSDGRFRLFEAIRTYAAARRHREDRADDAHGAWYARLGTDEALGGLIRAGRSDRLPRVRADLDNLLAALERAVAEVYGAPPDET